MRHLFLATAVGLSLSGTDLATDYARARTLRTTSELGIDLETTRMDMTIDGEPIEGEGSGGNLYVSLAEHRPVALELEGELSTDSSFEREREGQLFSSHSVQSGTLTLNLQMEGL